MGGYKCLWCMDVGGGGGFGVLGVCMWGGVGVNCYI